LICTPLETLLNTPISQISFPTTLYSIFLSSFAPLSPSQTLTKRPTSPATPPKARHSRSHSSSSHHSSRAAESDLCYLWALVQSWSQPSCPTLSLAPFPSKLPPFPFLHFSLTVIVVVPPPGNCAVQLGFLVHVNGPLPPDQVVFCPEHVQVGGHVVSVVIPVTVVVTVVLL